VDRLAESPPGVGLDEALPALIGVLERHPDAGVRYDAAHALSWTFDRRAVAPLLHALERQAEAPLVRGQAAEGVGILLTYGDRRRKEFKRATSVLLGALRDEAPEVRFWAAYALGAMRATAALDELRRVAESDGAMCPGWWLVKDEAADAAAIILGGNPPHRRPAGARLPEEPEHSGRSAGAVSGHADI